MFTKLVKGKHSQIILLVKLMTFYAHQSSPAKENIEECLMTYDIRHIEKKKGILSTRKHHKKMHYMVHQSR